jgi:hypothetical protein
MAYSIANTDQEAPSSWAAKYVSRFHGVLQGYPTYLTVSDSAEPAAAPMGLSIPAQRGRQLV